MSISGIGNNSIYTSYLNSLTQSSSAPSSAGQIQGGQGHRREGGDDFMQSVMQALSQMGVAIPGQMPPPPGTLSGSTADSNTATGATSATPSASTPTESPRHAMHQFMHDLFAALNSQNQTASGSTGADSDGDNDGSTTAAAAGTSGYSSLTSGLQNLIQELGASGTSTAAGGSLSNLQSDFSNLVAALQPAANGSSTDTSATSGQNPDLQTFLQNLLTGIQSHQTTASAALGSAVSVQA